MATYRVILKSKAVFDIQAVKMQAGDVVIRFYGDQSPYCSAVLAVESVESVVRLGEQIGV